MNRFACGVGNMDLAELCITLGRAMYNRAEQFLSQYGLTPPQFEVMTILAHEDAVAHNMLGEHLCCARSNITGIVDRLERDGLVKRERSGEDRRVVYLRLTEKGHEVWSSVPCRECCGIDLDKILDENEIAQLRSILAKLVAGAL